MGTEAVTSRFSSWAQDIQWNAVGQEAAQLLGRYIRVNTANPPGNEGEAARFLSEILSGEGLHADIHESAPGRANLVARLSATAGPGRRGAPALLLLHHMDVVPARPERWSAKPFDGAMRNGYVWGRGAIDDKGLGVIHLMAFILLKRLGIPLKRDVIFLAVADEEEGGEFGTQWMIRNHWPEIECQYVWDEGGTGSQGVMGNRPVFAISVSEKRRLLVRLVASGQSGHASMAAGTPIDRLINALYSLQRYRPGIGFNEMTREFFAKIAQTQPFPASWLLRRAAHPVVSPLIARRLARVPSINAMLRDTLTATVVNAGQKANVSPDTAEAVLDARLLPDTDDRGFLEAIRHVIDDESITVEATRPPASPPPSPTDSAMYGALERVIEAHVPDAIITPLQTPVATDSRFFRHRGAEAYGLIPAILTQGELDTIHGGDERISVENLVLGTRIALHVIAELCV